MATKPPALDTDVNTLRVTEAKHWAAGVRGVLVSVRRGFQQMGVARTVRTLRLLSQHQGLNCPGSAWPDPLGRRKLGEWTEPTGMVSERRAKAFRVTACSTARGCTATYFPEGDQLVPPESVAETSHTPTSHTPTSKSSAVRLEKVAT